MKYFGLIGILVVAFIAMNGLRVKNSKTRSGQGEASLFLIEPIAEEHCPKDVPPPQPTITPELEKSYPVTPVPSNDRK